MNIGDTIKRYRNEKKISQRSLAQISGVSFAYIQQLEKGDKKNPSTAILQKLADALNTNVYNLIDNGDNLTSKLIQLFEKTVCKGADAENTLELICESIDIDEEVINKSMENSEDISESYLVALINEIYSYDPTEFFKFYKANEYLISSDYLICYKRCEELKEDFIKNKLTGGLTIDEIKDKENKANKSLKKLDDIEQLLLLLGLNSKEVESYFKKLDIEELIELVDFLKISVKIKYDEIIRRQNKE